jgi:hypothetical protein
VNDFYLEQQQYAHDVYKDLLLQQGISQRVAHVAAYALMEMIGSTVQEFMGIDNPLERETLKRLVGGVLRSLMPEQGVPPVLPHSLLNAISTAGQAHRRPGRTGQGKHA